MRHILIYAFVLLSCSVLAQNDLIELPAPEKTGGMPLMDALDQRHSARDFSNASLSDQTMSNLLWAAFGINRPESGKRTAPSSHNVQDIEIYLTTKDGAYRYRPEKHALQTVSEKDLREFMGKQDFTKDAAVNLVYVSDFNKFEGDGGEQLKREIAGTHCGFIGQNVYLFCASEGLNTVFRAWIDAELIHEKLGLKPHQHVMFSQSVGYPGGE